MPCPRALLAGRHPPHYRRQSVAGRVARRAGVALDRVHSCPAGPLPRPRPRHRASWRVRRTLRPLPVCRAQVVWSAASGVPPRHRLCCPRRGGGRTRGPSLVESWEGHCQVCRHPRPDQHPAAPPSLHGSRGAGRECCVSRDQVGGVYWTFAGHFLSRPSVRSCCCGCYASMAPRASLTRPPSRAAVPPSTTRLSSFPSPRPPPWHSGGSRGTTWATSTQRSRQSKRPAPFTWLR